MSKNVMVWKHFLDIRELELGPRVELKKKDWERYYMVKHGMTWYDMV